MSNENYILTQSDSSSGSCTNTPSSFGGLYFSGDLDKQFIKNVTKELIMKIVNQKVFLYSVDHEKTVTNTYDEAESKVFKSPVQTWGTILYNDPVQNIGSYSYDTKYSVQINFYNLLLEDQDIKIREGDVCRLGGPTDKLTIFYEITNLIKTKPLFGQTENLLSTRAICTTARKSLLTVLNRMEFN